MKEFKQRHRRLVPNYLLIWFENNTDEANNSISPKATAELQEVINNVNIFVDFDECIDFITDIKEDKLFLIVSGKIDQSVLSILKDITQINCIYIFDSNQTILDRWTKQYSKVRGIFTDISVMCRA